ncbi:hypothetical protein XELAEV_18027752mg [Xenopus laevis]|uniref:glycogenin glucosyltransferase n=1 Tax=Xenopus laevis TaxID=8355 RepID=A0A974CYA9_XENLA|nr:hypothetical protein XELAEV_18027752mg [Xenopus laevis]
MSGSICTAGSGEEARANPEQHTSSLQRSTQQQLRYGSRYNQAFVTLATNDTYVKGALVLGSSLRQHNTANKLAVLITPQVSDSMRKVLDKVYDDVRVVDVLDSGDSAHLALMKRPELGVTLTKIHCWTLTEYSKCVFMDADTMVLCNIDELFEREELSAAPDPGWPDCFNSGVFVFIPSFETYNKLIQLAAKEGSFDGQFGANAKVVHFLGKVKPWNYTYDSKTKSVRSDVHDQTLVHPEFLNLWWDIYTTRIVCLLTQEGVVKEETTALQVEEVKEAVVQMSISHSHSPPSVSSEERRERWEQGQVDYMGEDSYDNIKKKLDSYLQ